VKARAIRSLRAFMSPTPPPPVDRPGAEPPPEAAAWPFGQSLYISDIYARLKGVAGVEHVTGVKLWWCRLPLEEELTPADLVWQPAREEVIPVPAAGLICLLDWAGLAVVGPAGG